MPKKYTFQKHIIHKESPIIVGIEVRFMFIKFEYQGEKS